MHKPQPPSQPKRKAPKPQKQTPHKTTNCIRNHRDTTTARSGPSSACSAHDLHHLWKEEKGRQKRKMGDKKGEREKPTDSTVLFADKTAAVASTERKTVRTVRERVGVIKKNINGEV
ncbi:hypothetical protein CFOL_v3_06355 [Cephalotus follicularis]|uniref:Uncharacterized protein n=1 Tax=Cephalotus follicularis TaxID=3775 RepID=A0A1Q3B4Z8_CEPFO|nr:hypothetical protein CFOL_v3_06355 [Cephalotus follicularis]